jgi:hypothetical protein
MWPPPAAAAAVRSSHGAPAPRAHWEEGGGVPTEAVWEMGEHDQAAALGSRARAKGGG